MLKHVELSLHPAPIWQPASGLSVLRNRSSQSYEFEEASYETTYLLNGADNRVDLCSCNRKLHQHNLAPEVQTTGDTTPVQQIVYAVSLTTSGRSNA